MNFEKLIVESGKIISCVFFVMAAFFAIKGLPRVSDTDRYFRPPGEVQRVSGKWSSGLRFSEVSLKTGQTIYPQLFASQNGTSMTGLSFSASNRNCLWTLVQNARSSLKIELSTPRPSGPRGLKSPWNYSTCIARLTWESPMSSWSKASGR